LTAFSDRRQLPPLLQKTYNFRRRCLIIDHFRYHFVDEGDSNTPPVLMLHGNPTWSFFFRRLIRSLKQNYRVIAPDHMGCGLSDKPQKYPYRLSNHMHNVERLMDHLDLKQITLICHDWGGAIGMGVAARRPDLFDRFVILNTAAWRSERLPKRIAVCRIPVLGPLAVRGFNGFALAATKMAVAKPLDAVSKMGLIYPYNNWTNRIATLRFVQDIPMNPLHPSYTCLKETERLLYRLQDKPMKICWGMKDWCFDSVFLDQWRDRFPKASVSKYPNAGHYILEDAHEGVLQKITRFLRQTDS
jgi:pimeloyl-ACP methyl ester carboxylesterase